jgi:hypothetical protein
LPLGASVSRARYSPPIPPPDETTPASETPSAWLTARKIGLLAATSLVAINIWTGAPLLSLWVGSRVQGSSGVSMTALFVVVLVLAVLVFALGSLLTWLNALYDDLVGRAPTRERHPWLRSLSAEREAEVKRERGVTGVERIVIFSVVAAVLAFEIWFFFFAKYSFGP